jgi:hypothetical protein
VLQSDLIGDNSVDSVAIDITLELLRSLLLGTYKLPSRTSTIENKSDSLSSAKANVLKVRKQGGSGIMEEMRIHDKPKNFLLGGYWLRAHEMRAQALDIPQQPHGDSSDF